MNQLNDQLPAGLLAQLGEVILSVVHATGTSATFNDLFGGFSLTIDFPVNLRNS